MIERVVLPPSVRATLGGHIAAVPGRETGGILLGRTSKDGVLEVVKASPPGPRAVHRRFYFSRDTKFLQRWLDEEYSRSDGAHDYVGEWHVHRALDAPPSCVDKRSLWRIAKRANYATSEPILLIAEEAPPQRPLRAYRFTVGPRHHEEVACDLPS